MAFYEQFLDQTKFGSYEDYLKNFHVNVPENFNYAFDVLDKIAEAEPDRVALVWEHVDGREKTLTFGDIAKKSNQAARALQKMGIQKGDAVMLVLKRHYSFWYTIMALHKLGAITVPATHLLTKKDIVYRADAADIKMILAVDDGAFPAHADEAVGDCPTLEKLVIVDGAREGWEQLDLDGESDAPLERPTLAPDDIMLLYFTSGTSGMPKMVAHNFAYPLGHIQTAVYWQQCIDGGLHLTVSETGWAKSVWGKLYGQWMAGSAVMAYDFEKFIPKNMLAILEKHRVTTFCAPPTIYRFMLLEDVSQYDLSALKHCSIAGEPLSPELYNKWKEQTGHELYEIYGQTELCVTIGTFPWMKICPGSMGKPSPLFDVDLIDDDGNTCPPGVVGEIVVRVRKNPPPGMFMGYYRDPERTKSVWSDGIYHTLDLAWRDEWGYFWYVGRADDVIKSSGYRIGPFEVESALLEHPAVMETAITAVPDPVRGQAVKATIVLNAGYVPSDELKKELQDHVKRTTAPYKYPRIVEFVSELPKTISGKIRRVAIREAGEKKE